MATTPAYLPPRESENFGSDLAGMFAFFADPAGAARRVHRRWFWIAPLTTVILVSILAGIGMEPIVRQVSALMPVRPGATPEQQQRAIEIGIAAQRIFTPLSVLVMILIQSVILYGTASALTIRGKFREFLNLVAGCSLISSALTSIAAVIILRSKGEVSSVAELTPALGLDIFLPPDANKFVTGLLGYFSVFQLWWIVMMVLIVSAAFRVSKGKALATVTPLILLGLLMRIGLALFRGQR
ncbi:MAG TPA: YIP1 family protein [Bryobacteraceae bacterium]|nr:YIP1 family protein [Bryobacteraceae bacterium]